MAQYICEKMSKDQYLAGSGMPAWEADMGDTSDLNRLSQEIAELTADATGYVYWLDSLQEAPRQIPLWMRSPS